MVRLKPRLNVGHFYSNRQFNTSSDVARIVKPGFLPQGGGGLRQSPSPQRLLPPEIWSENNTKICITIDFPPEKNSWKKARNQNAARGTRDRFCIDEIAGTQLQNIHRIELFPMCCRCWGHLTTRATTLDFCRRTSSCQREQKITGVATALHTVSKDTRAGVCVRVFLLVYYTFGVWPRPL